MIVEKLRRLDLAFLSDDTPTNRWIWSLLAAQSGIINVGAFLITARFVTHITGFATHFGADLAVFNWADAISMLTVPLFFLLGAMISAFYIDYEVDHGREAKYRDVFFIMIILLIAVCLLSLAGYFEVPLSAAPSLQHKLLISLLCLVSGIQNASISTASKRVIRTTHMTGLTTDLGVGFVRGYFSKNQTEKNANTIRILILLSFVLGSALGAYIFLEFSHNIFIVPLIITTGIYLHFRKHLKK